MKNGLLMLVALAAFTLSAASAQAQQAPPKAKKVSAPAMCQKLSACISRGMTGQNQYNTRYDRATAEGWCKSNGYAC